MATPASNNSYQRLPGNGYRQLVPGWAILLLFFVIGIFALVLRGRQVRLYLGDDYLLVVEWDGAKEYYKRFRYEDIQTIVVRRSKDALALNIFAGVLTVVLYLLALAVTDEPVLMWFLSVLGTIVLIVFLVNLGAGPTCQCHLRTAVQVEELVSLGRLRRAERVLRQLRERIVAVQGELTPEEIPARAQQKREAMAPRYVVDNPNAPPRMI